MITYERGSVADFEVTFTTTAGTVLQVTAATLTIQHPLDGFPHWNGTHTTSYAMTNTSTVTGSWEYHWDTSPSAGGIVTWHILPGSTQAVARSGAFKVRSLGAATWVLGPSTETANDEIVP